MLLINQDRDRFVEFTPELINTGAAYAGEKLIGFNLYSGNVLLGTFDSMKEVLTEVVNIFSCTGECYAVSGHSDFEQWDDLEAFIAADEIAETESGIMS